MPPLKDVVHADLVRFRLPSDWVRAEEEGDVALWGPPESAGGPSPGGALRVLAEALEGGDPEARLMEMATRFVQPDDARAGDRALDRLPDGAVLATLYARAEVEGERMAFYLWMKGAVVGGRAVSALFSYALPAGRDGDPGPAETLGLLDAEIRAARLG